jgi:hypothetical protein
MKAEEPANLKWNQHPVISAVLWMLGTDTSQPNNNNVRSTSTDIDNAAGPHSHGAHHHMHGSHNVLWKDEHGGSINEYFNQIQTSQHGPGSPIRLTESTKSKENTPIPNVTPQNPLAQKDHSSHPHEEHDIDTFQSPQWGFYVSITPPQQEVYGRQQQQQQQPPQQVTQAPQQAGHSINSIQADHRKRQ